MSRNPHPPLNPERSEYLCDVVKIRPVLQYSTTTRTEAKYEVFNERKCETSRDQRECDEAYGVTAIFDQDVFRKDVGTNFQPFLTFGQQCTAVPEDKERRVVFASAKIVSSSSPTSATLMLPRSSSSGTLSSSLVSSCSSNVESSKSSSRESSSSRK